MDRRASLLIFGDVRRSFEPHPHLTRSQSYWLEAHGRSVLIKRRYDARWVAILYRIDADTFRLIKSRRPTSERKARRWAERVLGLYAAVAA